MGDEVRRVTAPNEGIPFKGWDASAPIPAPLSLHDCTVRPEWTDYNGHMSESIYLLVMGDHSDAFFRYFGIDEAYRATGRSLYTVDTRVRYLRECSQGDRLRFTLQLLDLDAKRLHIFHEMLDEPTGALIATGEQVLVHVDMKEGRSSPLPPELFDRLDAIRRAHAVLPLPQSVGQPLGLPRKTKDAAP